MIEVCDVLKPFGDATDIAQGNKTVSINFVIPTILDLNSHLKKYLNIVRYCRVLCNSLLISLQRRFYGIFQNCGLVNHYERTGDPPFVDNVYLMASALDPMFAYHWIDIDVEVEHNEAQTSQGQHIIKRKIEELVVKGAVLARKTASSRIIAEIFYLKI